MSEEKINPKEALKLFKENSFNSFPKQAKSLGFFYGEIWYAFEVESTKLKEPLYLNFKDVQREMVNLFIFKDDKLIKKSQSGYLLKIQKRDVKSFAISFKLLSNTKAIYLIKANSNHPHFDSFSFGTKEQIDSHWDKYHYFSIFICGIFISLILYNLFLYFIIKNKSYIFYIIYMIGLVGANLLTYGYLQIISHPLTPFTPQFIVNFAQIGLIGIVFFTEYFLDMKKSNYEKFIIINRSLLAISILSLFLIPFGSIFQAIAGISINLLFILLLYVGYKKYNSGYKPALFYLLATGVNLICGTAHIFMYQWNIIPYSYLSYRMVSFGLVWDMIVLSLALAYKVRLMEQKNIQQERLLIIQSRYENMGEITGNIAHQWRTPLGRLGSIFTNLLAKSKYSSLEKKEMEESLQKSNEIIQHLSNTIDTFQNFFTKSADDKIHLNHLLNNLFEFIKESKEYENIEIKIDIKKDIQITSNENELSQIILSIIVNAKDALIKNNIKNPYILIKADKKDSKVSIYIEDNGGGINIEPKEDIFKAHTTNKKNGTGLGLYISKILADKNNITIAVKNNKNGAIFLLNFN